MQVLKTRQASPLGGGAASVVKILADAWFGAGVG